MTSTVNKNTNFLALVTAASLMTSEAAPAGMNTTSAPRKNRMLMDSSLSVVSHSDNDDEYGSNGNKLTISDGALTDSSEPLSDDDLTPYDQPKAPPPIIQPEAPPPAPPPPPPAVVNLNRTNTNTNCGSAGGSVSDSSGTSHSHSDGSSSGSGSNSSPPRDVGMYRVYHNNKPQSLPITLMNLLTSEEFDDILSFLPHGKCFIIKQTKEFAKKLMQQHFHLSKFGSFVSRLQRWGFAHLQDSILPGQHAFYHPLFEKGKWEPLGKMMYQPKSTKAFKNKLTKSMASRAGLNHSLRRNSLGVSGAAMGGSLKESLVRLHSSNRARNQQHAQLLGRDLALVSQSTVNHATQNIVDAAIACLRRDEELLSVPRLAVPKNTNPAPVLAAVAPAPSRKKAVSFHNHNHNQHNNAPTRRSMVEPLPPLPPVPTNRNRNVNVGPPPPRHSMGVMSPTRNIARRVSVSPTVYADGLLRSATSQMMLWQQTQHQAQVQQQVRQPHPHQPAPTMVNRHQPLPPHQMGGQQHCNSSRSAFVVPAGGGGGPRSSGVGSPMDSFRRDMYLPSKHQHRAQEELLVMPQHRQARSFVPVNSFYI